MIAPVDPADVRARAYLRELNASAHPDYTADPLRGLFRICLAQQELIAQMHPSPSPSEADSHSTHPPSEAPGEGDSTDDGLCYVPQDWGARGGQGRTDEDVTFSARTTYAVIGACVLIVVGTAFWLWLFT